MSDVVKPTTCRDVANLVRSAINTDVNLLQCGSWVSERFKQICSRTRLSSLREVGQLTIPAAVHAGTASVSLGSTYVDITDLAALAAIAAITEGLQDWWFKGQTNYYEITGTDWRKDGSLRLTLKAPYADQTSNPQTAFYLLKRFIRLDARARWVGETMTLPNRNVTIMRMSPEEMDLAYPRRPVISGFGPLWWCQQGLDEETQSIVVEFYPYSSVRHLITYIMWRHPYSLDLDDPLPPKLDAYILREGALIDAFRYESAKSMRAKDVEGAAFWRNESRAQMTSWERQISEAIRNDRGTNDIAFMLRSGWERRPRDVVSARDEIYARGNRP
jgi:hypothetical protein